VSIEIRQRSLPDSLRWLAGKLDSGPLTGDRLKSAAFAMHALADKILSERAHCGPGLCLGLTCCSYECSQGQCPSVPTEFRESTP
jgi:hypothetical protein